MPPATGEETILIGLLEIASGKTILQDLYSICFIFFNLRNRTEMGREVFRVAGAELTDTRDCNVYLVNGEKPILVDTGFGVAVDATIQNIRNCGVEPSSIDSIILTHCHIDHIGAAAKLRDALGAKLIMHEEDARIVMAGDNRLTAAFCFEVQFQPLPIDVVVSGSREIFVEGDNSLILLHTPGHTPGSISPYFDTNGRRFLFGQDLGAPLLPEFDCDPIAWRQSMDRLLSLEADVLCDGHSSGIYEPARRVASYIRHFVRLYGKNQK
jgi:glyoxylase-like metal-dependent hydrolase (beta-lactamase superfamily II)